MDNQQILYHLRSFIEEKEKEASDKGSVRLINTLKAVTEESISVGEQPKYFFAI